MSTDTSTAKSTSGTATVPDWDRLPCVQYGFPEEKGPFRGPKLRTIFEPVPDDAITASPIYILTRNQYERQERLDSGYEVSGDYTSIATELQDECEDDGRVLYPIHIESDVYLQEGPENLIEWFQSFVEDDLGVPFGTCRLYFSGNRSIHVHVPRFVKSEADRVQLKERAESFCREAGADLDLGLYSRKRLFRLPGVEHEKSGLTKVEIEPTWDHSRIIRESNRATLEVPESYATVLQSVFLSPGTLTVEAGHLSADDPRNLFRVLDSEKTVLGFTTENTQVETPLVEQTKYPEDSSDVPKWAMYNAKEFSPYAYASGNPRSVAALKVKGGAFARKGKRNGAAMVPAYFYGAVGCNGEYTKEQEHAPLQLSEQDYRKWDATPGESVVVIGGQSRNSLILSIEAWEARVVGHALTTEGDGRSEALDYLESEGYEIGTSGSTSSPTSSQQPPSGEARRIFPARENPGTEAERLQKLAEQEGIESLSHGERIRVACRHLRQGWTPTWEWFKEQYGSEFDPEVTWTFLRGIVEADSFEEYNNIDVPDSPT